MQYKKNKKEGYDPEKIATENVGYKPFMTKHQSLIEGIAGFLPKPL